MDTTLMTELQDRLESYLSGKTTLREFEEWFVPATWDAQDTSNPQLERLRNIIDARIAEYTNGDWTEDELKDFLRPFAETKVIPFALNTHGVAQVRTGNQSTVHVQGVALTIAPATGAATLLAPNPQVLASRPESLDDEPERNPREQFVLEA
jgi:hypothetical protein